MRPIALAIRAIAALMLALLMAAPAHAAEPTAQVETLNTALIDTMKQAEQLGFDGRFALLSPVLTSSFNFPAMARIAVGSHWNELDKSQRARLVDAFARMSISTFASRFDGYSGEQFEILGARPAARGNMTVLNQIVEPSGKATAINYVVHEFDGSWKIVDIFLDGKISELALARSEYVSVIRREGFDSLLATLEAKIARLANQ